jgi:Holliday junction resolvase-like predicted endonuclease
MANKRRISYKFIMKKLIQFSLFCALVFSSFVHAKPSSSPRIDEYFKILSYEKTDFDPTGAVCERVAIKEVETIYPSVNYNIINSISYDERKTTIGELDLVIFDKISGKVEAIAEVKCWKSFSGALKKVKNQRMRFISHLNNNIVLQDTEGKKYSKDLFKNVQRYFSISQSGGMNQGFDFELSLDLNELMQLRSQLLDCRAQGHCPKK